MNQQHPPNSDWDLRYKQNECSKIHPLLHRFYLGLQCLLLSLLNFQSCSSTKKAGDIAGEHEQEWRIVKTDKGEIPSWVIHTRKIHGTRLLAYKIEGRVEAAPLDCRAAFRADIQKQAEDEESKEYPTYDIVEESDSSLLTYVVHCEPFPFKDTEMSVRYHFYDKEDGSVGVDWKEAWEESFVPPSKKLKRVETFRGSWDFSPTDDGASNAVNIVSFDLKKMPRWLAQPMVIKFLKNGLKDIRAKTAQTLN